MPLQEGQVSVAEIDLFVGKCLDIDINKDEPALIEQCYDNEELLFMQNINLGHKYQYSELEMKCWVTKMH